MKTYFKTLLLMIVILINDGCKKYEENPLINLRSREYRLTGNTGYTVSSFYINGIDSTHGVAPLGYISFDEERDGQRILATAFFHGTRDFDDHKKYLHIGMGDSGGYPYGVLLTGELLEWRITKLTDRELHINTDYKGKNYVIHLSKKKF